MIARIIRFQVRRERAMLPAWVLGVVALFAGSGVAIAREFGDEQARSALMAVAAGNPAFLFLRGLPDGAGAGAVTFFQTFTFLAVLVGLMNVFLVSRHTRAEEATGRAELLQAAGLGRTTELVSTLTLAVIANAVVAVLVTASGAAIGLGFEGSLVTGLALASVGITFAGVTALAAQLMPTPRGVTGLGAALVGVAYVARGIGDALGTATDLTHVSPSWISELSPIGWAQRSRPFSESDLLPLLVPVALGVLTAAIAVGVRQRRDLGASLLQERLGRPGWAGAGVVRLAARDQLGATIGWCIGVVVLGLLAGVLSPIVAEAVGSNDELAALIGRLQPDLSVETGDLFAVALLGISATLAAAAGVQALVRARSEEAEGRAELLLTTPLSRTRWFGAHLMVAVTSTLIVALAAGLATGLGFVLAGDDPSRIATSLAAIGVQVPAGLVFIAVTALAFSLVPRFTAAAGWGALALGLVLGQLGDLLALPRWLQDFSPFRHVPAVPIEPVDPFAIVVLLAVATAGAVAAEGALRARDMPA